MTWREYVSVAKKINKFFEENKIKIISDQEECLMYVEWICLEVGGDYGGEAAKRSDILVKFGYAEKNNKNFNYAIKLLEIISQGIGEYKEETVVADFTNTIQVMRNHLQAVKISETIKELYRTNQLQKPKIIVP